MDFTECYSDTCSSVAIAAKTGNIELLRTFLEQKRPVDVSDNRGWKPLHEAAALSPSLLCLEELLKHEDTNINWMTHEGETALLLACKRRRANEGAKQIVSLLLEYGANPNIKDNEEDTPLLAAVRNGSSEVVDLLIAAGANVNARDCSKWSPLHEAASKNDIAILKSLLKKGARIDKKDECGMTPIFTAAQHGAERCLRELLAVALERGQQNSVNIGAEDWATPLMIAAQQGFVTCVKLLLQYGGNPNLKTSDQVTALHLAVQGNHNECLKMILKKMDLQPLITAFDPKTYQSAEMICPLHLAIEYDRCESLKILLEAGFSPDSLYDCIGLRLSGYLPDLPDKETALSYAVSRQCEGGIAILLAAGASVNPPLEEAYHPLLRAMSNPTMEEFHILIECGANVNFRRQQRPTNEVFLYCLISNSIYLKPLLYYGCDPNVCFETGHDQFVTCCLRFLRREGKAWPLPDFIKFLLRFLIISRNVQNAIHSLNARIPAEMTDILNEIDKPSSLKQICFVKLRQYLYHVHGTNFPNVISRLCLPPILEEYIACRDLQYPSIDEPLIINR